MALLTLVYIEIAKYKSTYLNIASLEATDLTILKDLSMHSPACNYSYFELYW